MNLNSLETFFNSIELPKELVLSKCEVIKDVPKLINTHLSYLKANSGNIAYKPYFDRLLVIYRKLNNLYTL